MTKLLLADQGQAKLPIALEADACLGQRRAAGELAHYLKRITGADFAIEEGSATGGAIALKVDGSLPEEGFRLKTEGGGLIIAGGSITSHLVRFRKLFPRLPLKRRHHAGA